MRITLWVLFASVLGSGVPGCKEEPRAVVPVAYSAPPTVQQEPTPAAPETKPDGLGGIEVSGSVKIWGGKILYRAEFGGGIAIDPACCCGGDCRDCDTLLSLMHGVNIVTVSFGGSPDGMCDEPECWGNICYPPNPPCATGNNDFSRLSGSYTLIYRTDLPGYILSVVGGAMDDYCGNYNGGYYWNRWSANVLFHCIDTPDDPDWKHVWEYRLGVQWKADTVREYSTNVKLRCEYSNGGEFVHLDIDEDGGFSFSDSGTLQARRACCADIEYSISVSPLP